MHHHGDRQTGTPAATPNGEATDYETTGFVSSPRFSPNGTTGRRFSHPKNNSASRQRKRSRRRFRQELGHPTAVKRLPPQLMPSMAAPPVHHVPHQPQPMVTSAAIAARGADGWQMAKVSGMDTSNEHVKIGVIDVGVEVITARFLRPAAVHRHLVLRLPPTVQPKR